MGLTNLLLIRFFNQIAPLFSKSLTISIYPNYDRLLLPIRVQKGTLGIKLVSYFLITVLPYKLRNTFPLALRLPLSRFGLFASIFFSF